MFKELNTGLIHFSSGFSENLHGLCLVLRSDGLLCCGEFSDNQLNGRALIWKNEQQFFMGTFQRGQLQFNNTSEKSLIEFFRWVSLQSKKFKFIKHKTNNSHFFGTIEKDGKPQGLGLVIHEDGKLNHGQYRDGKMNGYCLIQLKNDDRYTGQCQDGKIEGFGIFYQAQQKITFFGQFYKGECQNIIESQVGLPKTNLINQLEVIVFQNKLPQLYLQDLEQYMLNTPKSNTKTMQFSKSCTETLKKNESLYLSNKKFEIMSVQQSSYLTKGQNKTSESCQTYEMQNSDPSFHNEILSSKSIMNPEEEDSICRFKQIMENLSRLKQNISLPPQSNDPVNSSQCQYNDSSPKDTNYKMIDQDVSHQSYLPGLEIQRLRFRSKVDNLVNKRVSKLDDQVNNRVKKVDGSRQFSQTMQSFTQTDKTNSFTQTRSTLKKINLNKTQQIGVDKSSQCYSSKSQDKKINKTSSHSKQSTSNKTAVDQGNNNKTVEERSTKNKATTLHQFFSRSQTFTQSRPISCRIASPQGIQYIKVSSVSIVKQSPKPAFVTIRKLPSVKLSYSWMSQSAVLSKKI